MKNKILMFLLVVVVVLGVICAAEWRELKAARLRLAEAQQAHEAEAVALVAQEDRTRQLERQRDTLNQQVDQFVSLVNRFRASESSHASNIARLAAPNAATTNASDAGKDGLFGEKGMGGMLSRMMKDPAMKEMLRSQQKTIVQKMYGALLKDLNLTPEQKDRFLELLQDRQMSAMDQAGALFGEGNANKTEAVKAMTDREKETEANLRALLGEEKFAQYEEYKKSIGERVQLDQFRQQLEGGSAPLQDEQMRSLMAVMQEERGRVPPLVPENASQSPADLARLLTDDTLQRQMQWQEDLNRRVQERAGQVLTPQQLREFTEFQAQQINMQRVGMRMAREMFGSGRTPSVERQVPEAPRER